jgi:F-type H+-transporting ATPase subunit b
MEQGIILESVWVAVGFIVFVALVWRKVGAALGRMLDERSNKIRADLKEAQTS